MHHYPEPSDRGRLPASVALIAAGFAILMARMAPAAEIAVDLQGYRPDCGIRAEPGGDRLALDWPAAEGERGRLVLDLRPGAPLVASLGLAPEGGGEARAIVAGVDPVAFLVVGSRQATPGRPPGMDPFNEFFDAPAKRPHRAYRSRLDLKRARVTSQGRRATVALGDLAIGPFAGELQITLYAGSRLVHVEAVVSTQEAGRAVLYDAGLVAAEPTWERVAWIDTEGELRREAIGTAAADRPLAVRHRAIVAEAGGGAVAALPPPHQFFDPRDLTENLKTAWSGRGHRGLEDRVGFGVRQSEAGGGAYAPWFNAPPGTEQRLGVFYLPVRGDARAALDEALRYTNGDRFPDLPGYRTFASHWHMAIAVAALREQAAGGRRTIPDFVRMFKGMNVDLVHLAEFHGDGHPQDPGPLRLPELEAMFAECRRLSDDDLVLLPGEEANVHLGPSRPQGHPGHWLYLFPRPVSWTMGRAPDQPFVEVDPKYGKVYHVGDRAEMLRLLEVEDGLAWTAHARIKASSWAPDAYRDEDFFRSRRWLGAAWKAMPADLSSPRLGRRTLDLLDDMANWGERKYLLGEVDVFKLDRTHELYGHMNVNYVQLDGLPRFDDGWGPVLDALRRGRFFVTTGEVLMPEFTVDGRSGGETIRVGDSGEGTIRVKLRWTYPLRSVEVVWGDGREVGRKRVDRPDTGPFGEAVVSIPVDLRGRRWVRVEAWDVACNGAFSQPVWVETARAEGR